MYICIYIYIIYIYNIYILINNSSEFNGWTHSSKYLERLWVLYLLHLVRAFV